MNTLKPASVQAKPNVQKTDILSITIPMINRMKVEDKSDQTIKSYVRAVERLVRFHDLIHPRELDIDEVLDFLVSLIEHDGINWRTNKMYVAGLRYYWSHILDNDEFADKIPYPKEHPSLPKILSREDLAKLFESCNNPKHRVLFRLIYSSGLRRSELRHLKIHDIETADGKCRIRIIKGKGKKDRYTVLSKNVLAELREYFIKYRPKVYLFNGRKKGHKMSEGAIRHALEDARKRSGITREVTMHVLRHCFATHCLEHGMYIKRLQTLLGHSSLKTTLIYLQISEIPLVPDFSPLDIWENDQNNDPDNDQDNDSDNGPDEV
jgi:site-specific recombinase XerD